MNTRWIAAVTVCLGCATSGRATGTHPRVVADARPAGCEVEVLRDASPTRPVQSLGDVNVRCTGDAMGDVPGCTRALQDQVCALGGGVLWGVTSSQTDEALVMRGYAGRSR